MASPTCPFDFSRYYLTGELSDFTVQSAEQEFKVHKLILMEHSDFFAARCRGPWPEWQENKLRLMDDHPCLIEAMILFLYQTSYDDLVVKIGLPRVLFNVKLYHLAEKYLIPRLKESMTRELREFLPEHALEDGFSSAVAETYNCGYPDDRTLRDLFVETSSQNLHKLKRKKDFEKMVRETPAFAIDLVISRVASLGYAPSYNHYSHNHLVGNWGADYVSEQSVGSVDDT